MGKKAVRGGSLRAKVTGWLGAILLVMLLSIGLAAAVGRGTLRAFDGLLEDNAACYTVQEALAAETKAFARYVRESSQESEAEYAAACAATAESLDELPLDYAAIGEDRYARTWNLLQGYAGYCVYRDAFFQMSPAADGYVREMYHVMALQDFLAEYALRLTQATLEQQSGVYRARSTLLARMPWLYLGLAAAAVAGMLFLLRALSATVVVPLLGLAGASRRIAQNDFSGGDLPVKSGDEVGQLVRTFNQMKHAMAQFRTTQEALHREEVRNLTLQNDLEHTRLEVLKSQVDPHFLFNTLNMISCMARLEDASATDQMIVRLGVPAQPPHQGAGDPAGGRAGRAGRLHLFAADAVRWTHHRGKRSAGGPGSGPGALVYAAAHCGKCLLPRAESLRGGRAHPAAGVAAGRPAFSDGGRQRQGNVPPGAGRLAAKNTPERADGQEHRPGKHLPAGVDAVPGRQHEDLQPGGPRYGGAV